MLSDRSTSAHASSGAAPFSRRALLRAALGAGASSLLPAGAALAAAEAPAAPLGVQVRNQTTAPRCNGPENVALTFNSNRVMGLRIEAHHPSYVPALVSDQAVPAYLGCPPAPLPPPTATAPATRRTTLFETPELAVMGFALPDFWRRAEVPVRIGEVSTGGLDKVELWLKDREHGTTVIEMFPSDGSWHLRPLPPAHLDHTAFGAAVLIGPVAQAERLMVPLAEVDFAPQARLFTLHFADGGRARVHLARLDREALALDVELTSALSAPFGAIRGHYVTQSEADISRIAWRSSAATTFGEAPVMDFTDASDVTLLWAGRLSPARPAPSAPDLVFTAFAGA